MDRTVVDLFGFHALQIGLPELQALRANRMPHRWLALDGVAPVPPEPTMSAPALAAPREAVLRAHFDALPFASGTLDLVVLPHTLELAPDPHDTLREVERVLRPEGRVLLAGFNPLSLWGLRHGLGRQAGRIGLGGTPLLPGAGEFIGYGRARDWLRLLGLEIERSQFGLWSPPWHSERWLQRCAWMERAGALTCPRLGGVYLLQAVKRVRGMRLVGLARRQRAASARAVLTQRAAPAEEATMRAPQALDKAAPAAFAGGQTIE
ncbi:MAG: hypothetical protein RLY78_4345 [Pseudomonadota bacterium]|jgi:SAM-dependent methyltransferase